MRDLDDCDLDTVAGGEPNIPYKECLDGPAGQGLYPLYVNCYGKGFAGTILGVWNAARHG